VESRKAVKPFFRVPIDSSTAEAPDQLEGFAHRRVVHLALHNTNPNSLVEGRRSSFLRFVPRFAGLDTARQRTRAALPMTIRSQSDRSLVPSSSERRDDEHPTGAVGRQPERSAHLLRSRVRRDDPPPVGDGNDIAAQLGVGEAAFWVAPPSATMKRLSPRAIDGATGRTLLVVEDPDSVLRQAVAAGATEKSPAQDEHGWSGRPNHRSLRPRVGDRYASRSFAS